VKKKQTENKKASWDACDTMSVRDAEGGETTTSLGHPSNVRRGEGGTAFEDERSEAANLPLSLLIGGKGGCIPPNRRKGRFTPTRSTQCKGHALSNNPKKLIHLVFSFDMISNKIFNFNFV